MEDKLKKDIEAMVASIFSEKEEAESKRLTEEALQKSADTIEELTTSLESKNEEIASLETKMSESANEIETLKSELEAAKAEKEDISEKLVASEAKVSDMLKEQEAVSRMAELESAGVVRSDREAQFKKVKEMSSEDFDSYKDELVSIRESIKTELAKQSDNLESASSDDGVGTAPAKVDNTDQAALNLEVASEEDVLSKYSKLGDALASLMKTSK